MDKLPLEIFHGIFGYLGKRELENLNRVSRRFKLFTAHHLAQEIHVTYHEDDFRWLRQIASSRDTARRVRTIYFECDKLPPIDIDEIDLWEEHVFDEDIRKPKPDIPSPNRFGEVYPEEQTKYYRDFHKFRTQKSHTYSYVDIEKGWKAFRDNSFTLNEFMANMTPDGPWRIGHNVFAKLPNLNTLIFDSNNTFRPQSELWKSHFGDGLTHRSESPKEVFSQAITWLINIRRCSNAHISTLRLGFETWKSLIVMDAMPPVDVELHWGILLQAVSHLKHFEMNFTTLPDDDYDDPYQEIQECYGFLEGFPRLYQMIASAKQLQQLTLVFRPNWHAYSLDHCVYYEECDLPIYPIDRSRQRYMASLQNCFQNTTWAFLTNLKLWGIESASDEQLIAFFRRHPLIQRLDLKDMGLRKGSWIKVFEAIREPRRVSTCSLAGEFWSQGPPQEIWDLERATEKGGRIFDRDREKRRRDLQEWVCNRPKRPAPASGTTVEWRRIWGVGLHGVGYPYTPPLRWHLQP
ncbi:hypothetical protein MMC11_003482 [Xylographa trunciseda]|nr:hypothetical protein [Xylographa trunciseda]